MIKLNALAKSIALATLAMCATASVSFAATPSTAALSTASAAAPLSARAQQVQAMLPKNWSSNVSNAKARLGIPETEWSGIVERAINPSDYQCSSTAMNDWINGLDVSPLVSAIRGIYFATGDLDFAYSAVLDFAQYDAMLFGYESKANRFGAKGEYTQLLTAEMKDLRRFWDIDGSEVQLVPMHGADVYGSVDRLARLIQNAYIGVDDDLANLLGQIVYDNVQANPGMLANGGHPYLSLNAFAVGSSGQAGGAILMGDGIMQAMAAVGLGDVAPRAILGHEFGHHVQYQKNLFASSLPTAAERTRRTELMADSFSTYFLTHARGESLNAKRLLPSLQSFYQIGDCGFTSSGHHGTPNQRLRASTWGSEVADEAQKQGHILPAMTFDSMFEQKLPEFVAPDAQ